MPSEPAGSARAHAWPPARLWPLQLYTESTDGSYIESKESALVWHYKDADPDFGSWQAGMGWARSCLAGSMGLPA